MRPGLLPLEGDEGGRGRTLRRHVFPGAEYLDYLSDRPVHEANFRRRVRQLKPWVPRGARLFEVGRS
ncbi:MAG: hypothetical protein WA746_01520, partial [Isosphaeraceae bacterium]